MKPHALNERSIKNLAGVHPDLVRVVERAALMCDVPIVVTEGLRPAERQAELKAAGRSWTLDSRHLTGHAVDLVDADNYGYDIPDLDKIATAMKEASRELEIPIVWGGDWKTRDTPHFELDRKSYPASGVTIATQIAERAANVASDWRTVATASGLTSASAASGVVWDNPIIPPVYRGLTETIANASGWAKAVAGVDLRVAGLGFLAFGMTWLGVRMFSR